MAETKTPHFEISASVVRQLGDELVSDEVTAIVELVKNAYDADATYAHVVVNTTDPLPLVPSAFPDSIGYITIEDDGGGMDLADIERGWLMISLSVKRGMKARGEKTRGGRTPLGDKGLGRLSTQKLGRNLELITRKDCQEATVHVAFDWDAFTDDKRLSQVPVVVESLPADRGRAKGTILVVSGLRNADVWNGHSVDRLIKDLSQVISPFPEARPFMVTLRINGRPIDLGQISEHVRSAAAGRFKINFANGELSLHGKVRLAKFRGNDGDFFDRHIARDNGRAFFNYLKTRKSQLKFRLSNDPAYYIEFDYRVALNSLGGVESASDEGTEQGEPNPKVADPGPFYAEIDDFILRGDETGLKLGGLTTANEVQKIVSQHAGIKVFRDGFGVKPYGVNGEDWLRLGAQQTSGTSYYGLRPHNVIGFVAITEEFNGNLKEKTDREGFVNSPYSQNFRTLMVHSAETIGYFYEWTRRQYNTFRTEQQEKVKPFAGGQQAITDATSVSRRLTSYSERAAALQTSTSAARKKIAAVTGKIKSTPILASSAERELAGLLSEAQESLDASQALFTELNSYALEAKGLTDIVATLGPRLDVLRDQLQDFSELAGLGLLSENLAHEIGNQTDRLMQQATSASAKARKAQPQNTELLLFSQEVSASASALRRQIGHLAPSLRYQRDKIETFSVAEHLKGILDHFADRWSERGIGTQIDPTSQDFNVKTNRGRLTQVVDNIVLNSEYWLKQGRNQDSTLNPTITVKYAASRLLIWDNGPGVDQSVEEALFEPFITLKPKTVGRGLGLFISAQILDSMGCSIYLLPDRNSFGRRYIFEMDLSGIVDG